MANENRIPEIIRSSMENIRSMFDANKIVGDPINTPQGTTIIPISKISMGVAASGFDFNPKKEAQPRPQNFGGGGGTGVTVSPVGFLVVDPDGKVDLLNLNYVPSDPISQIIGLIENTPEIIEKFKGLFSSKKKEEE